MWNRARITSFCWMGALLILLNVLAPVLTQALRSAGIDARIPMELCVAGGVIQIADAASPADDGSPAPATDGGCPFCTHAPAAVALRSVAAALLIEQLRAAATLAPLEQRQPASAPPRPAASPRAPPAFA